MYTGQEDGSEPQGMPAGQSALFKCGGECDSLTWEPLPKPPPHNTLGPVPNPSSLTPAARPLKNECPWARTPVIPPPHYTGLSPPCPPPLPSAWSPPSPSTPPPYLQPGLLQSLPGSTPAGLLTKCRQPRRHPAIKLGHTAHHLHGREGGGKRDGGGIGVAQSRVGQSRCHIGFSIN